MKKILFTAVVTFCISTITFAQTPGHRTCGTIEHHEYLKQNRKNYEADFVQYNQMLDQYMQSTAFSNKRTSGVTINVPVVIHVVYNTATQNISDAQAISQFAVLNNDFNRLNADSVNTPNVFRTVAGGMGVNFCLAQRDPNGNPTTGIVHKSTSTTSFSTNDNVKHTSTGGDDPWDVTRYVNIWVCPLASPLLGYGEFPTGSLSTTWGLVLNYTATGTMGTAQSPFNKGRTGTHEFGHCFNLNHIWGDQGQCGASDGCVDTPPQKGGTTSPAGCNYGTPTFPWQPNTCTRPDGVAGANVTNTNGDMFMNYMDYTDDGAMNMFTKNQCARMLAVLTSAPWNVLQSSNGCMAPIALDANISNIINPANASLTCNNAVTPKVTVANSGSVTLTSVKVLYKMDATATQTLTWSGSLASGTSTVLTLNVYSGLTTAAHTFSVWTTLPNGGTDQNTANDSKSSTFTITTAPVGAALPFTERFENATFPPTGWTKIATNTLNAANTWTRVTNATGIPVTPVTTACARMDNYSGSIDITGQRDALRSPALSFATANSTLKLKFDVSHRTYAVKSDSLNVWISIDCGGTWSRIYNKGGTPTLATVTGSLNGAYTPTANAQWRRDSISLSAYAGQPSVYLKFESVSAFGNNVFLDNINVAFTAASAPPVANFSIAASPRCTGSSIQLTDMSTNTPTTWTWTATSSTGVAFSNANTQNPTVTFANAGTYTVTLNATNATGNGSTTQTLTINATPTVVVSNATICAGNSTTLTALSATSYSWNTGATTSSISVTPTALTVYTVTGTTSSCSNTKTVSVTVTPNPTVTVNNATICPGSSAVFTATGAVTYSWTTGATTSSISVSPTVTTNYSVTGTTSGCTNTKTLSVTVNTVPAVAATSATICSGTAGTLTASGASTYSWNTGANGPSLTASPTGNTTYTVTGTSTQGCIKTATASISVNATPTVAVNNATICTGNSGVLTVASATSYSWNTGATTASISVSPTITTTYTVRGTTGSCFQIKTATITVNSLPNISVASTTICAGSTGTLTANGASTYSWNTGGTNASIFDNPTGNTNYTVTGTSTAGCVKTATANIVVGTAPAITVNSASICAGSSATLTASGVSTYTWNTGSNAANITISPTGTTVYTVSGNLSGCTSTAVSTATVSVNNNPTVALSTIASPLCVNSSTVALSGSPVGGTFTGTGVSGSTFNPSASGAGTFTISYYYTDVNNCSNSANQAVVVSLCTGINELNTPTILVYPNPAKEAVNVSLDASSIANTTIELYDAIGKLVASETVNSAITTLSVSHLSKGMYTIRIIMDGKQTVRRIIKE